MHTTSTDLAKWSEQELLPVMSNVKGKIDYAFLIEFNLHHTHHTCNWNALDRSNNV